MFVANLQRYLKDTGCGSAGDMKRFGATVSAVSGIANNFAVPEKFAAEDVQANLTVVCLELVLVQD
jgi:ribosomal protein L9